MAYVTKPIREQLFIRPVWRSDAAKRRGGVMMAYDSSFPESRAAREAEGVASGNMFGSGSGNGDAIKQIVRWACENLIDSEVYELSELLQKSISETPIGGKGNASVLAGMDSKELQKWRDYGANFARKFVADRAKASASAEQDYFARYPNARRLEGSAGCGGVTTAASAKPIAADAAAEAAYYAKYPHARRLG